MSIYIIQFWYHTDLRLEKEIEAWNEVTALAMALNQIREPSWVASHHFHITIKRRL